MDALKGLAILLVVIGHAVQHSYADFDSNPLFRVIYSFRMPLFMFISGYVAFYGRDNRSWAHLRKKASLLVLPFAAWYALSYVITGAYLHANLLSYFADGKGLPELAPYLRAKYQLGEAAIWEIAEHMQRLSQNKDE